MIGPAEIEELLAEHASAQQTSTAPCWPVMRPVAVPASSKPRHGAAGAGKLRTAGTPRSRGR